MAGGQEPQERWLWYAARTTRSVALDPAAYPSIDFDRAATPFPSWACQSPNGGIHVDHRVGRIDVDVIRAPVADIELNWTDPYGVKVLSRAWFSEIEDLVDERTVFVGDVRRNGKPLKNWVTLHQARAPRLFGSESWIDFCPICGCPDGVLRGKLFFADPSVRGRPLIAGTQAIFVREDLALGRNLRPPAGSFKPIAVKYLANPPPSRPRPAWMRPMASPASPPEAQKAPESFWTRILSAIRPTGHRQDV